MSDNAELVIVRLGPGREGKRVKPAPRRHASPSRPSPLRRDPIVVVDSSLARFALLRVNQAPATSLLFDIRLVQ